MSSLLVSLQELSEPDGDDEVDDDDQEFGDMFGDEDVDLQPGYEEG